MAKTYGIAVRTSTPSGAIFANTACVRCDPAGIDPEADISDVADAIWSWWSTYYVFVISSSYTIQTLHLQELYNVAPPVWDKTINVAGSAVSGTALPRELCRVITLNTGIGGRRYRGRMFLPCPRNTGELLSSDANRFDTTSSWWSAGHSFCSDLLSGDDFTYGPAGVYSAHLSLRVHSRVGAFDKDVVGIQERDAVHFLRSRTSIP